MPELVLNFFVSILIIRRQYRDFPIDVNLKSGNEKIQIVSKTSKGLLSKQTKQFNLYL